jgi:poly(hydroxyalkanoate) depolymerase family esterase
MNAFSKDEMIKATQLTRAGRLKEAMSILSGVRNLAPHGAINPGSAQPQPGPTVPDRMVTFARQVVSPRPARLVPTPGGTFEARAFTNPSGKRAYKLFIPTTYRRRDLSLVVMLHGCTQNPDDFAAGTRMNELAEEKGFLVAYPAQSQSANIQKCWNWFSPADQHRDAGEPGIIAGITREIAAEFAIKPGHIYAAGLSAGGALAAILGVNYPDLFAAIGVHSGLACGAATDMTSAFTAMRRGGNTATETPSTIPTIVFHGDKDHTVNPINADQVVAHAQSTGEFATRITEGEANGTHYTRTVQTGPAGKPITEKWILRGAGHAWSGGSAAGSFATATGPDASREMVRFFLENSGNGRK